jgi:hypothetical protein
MLSKSRQLVIFVVACFFAVCIFAFAAGAQKSGATNGTTSVTGCMQKGDEPDEFSITGEDGKVYGLRSSSVKLADHVGQKVTVSGKLKAESDEKEEAKESKEGKKKEAGDIQVSSLKMVSASCQ